MDNFVVSARKYRPITFESVVGQNHITSTLKNAITRAQVAHAYLFCGPRGVGKTTCARILSKTLNCLALTDSVEPCGECESCRAFEESRSFNIHELDAASNNSVENIRALNEQVRVPPQIGKYSIYIIDEAHMLSTAAFNAFLKTLEEPPEHAIFILATTEKHKILPTILSRCQSYDFKRIKVEDMAHFLGYISDKESVSYDAESLHIISQKADGCMRDALSMYDKVVSFCGSKLNYHDVSSALNILDYDSYFGFVDAYRDGDYRSALLQLDLILQRGFDVTAFMGGLSNHLRNLLVASDSSTLSLLEVTPTIAERFKQQASTLSVSLIFDSLNIIAQSEASAKYSLNIRLLGEITILKLCNLSPIKLTSGSVDQSYTLPKISGGSATATTANNSVAQAPQQQPSVQATVQTPQQPTVQTPAPASTPEVVAKAPIQEIKVEPKEEVKPETKIEAKPSAKPEDPKAATERKSLLGVSIASISQSEFKIEEEERELVSCKDNESDYSTVITPDKEQYVLDGISQYAHKLIETRPRLASTFEHCAIVDGRLVITVANNIIKDEINTNRHSITSELMSFCPGMLIEFDIVVDEKIDNDKLVLHRDEDKLKYLVETNAAMGDLCSRLSLDFV